MPENKFVELKIDSYLIISLNIYGMVVMCQMIYNN